MLSYSFKLNEVIIMLENLIQFRFSSGSEKLNFVFKIFKITKTYSIFVWFFTFYFILNEIQLNLFFIDMLKKKDQLFHRILIFWVNSTNTKKFSKTKHKKTNPKLQPTQSNHYFRTHRLQLLTVVCHFLNSLKNNTQPWIF